MPKPKKKKKIYNEKEVKVKSSYDNDYNFENLFE